MNHRHSRYLHIGIERNPCTRVSMGERSRVRGTERTEDRATVWEMTASADTGHSSITGHLHNTRFSCQYVLHLNIVCATLCTVMIH